MFPLITTHPETLREDVFWLFGSITRMSCPCDVCVKFPSMNVVVPFTVKFALLKMVLLVLFWNVQTNTPWI